MQNTNYTQKLQVTYTLQMIDFYFIERYPCLTFIERFLVLRQTVLKYCIYSWQSFAKKLELGHET